jgi:aryl-alcohol dehydrogenase-like predicted oxidoreductase
MINRREFVGITLGAGATLALTPQLLRALQALQPGGTLIQRAIPSTGEMLPVIGLGFANHAGCADPAALREVLRTFVDNGGRVFDTNHQNEPRAQDATVTIVNELGVQDKLFFSMRGIAGSGGGPPATHDVSKAHIESFFTRFNVPRIDMVVGYPDVDPTYWGLLLQAKKEGRIRYLGTQVVTVGPSAPKFESIMRNEPLDFITLDYRIDRREAEEKILPLAAERKIAVLAVFPFGGAQGLSCVSGKGLFARVADTPLPEWAAEFDARTWAQFFLKYVTSHPAVTVVRVGTTKAHHMLDNIGGGIGRLPDEAMRRRMAAFIDALPAAPPVAPQQQKAPQGPAIVLSAAILDRYAGEYKAASGFTATFRRDGATLFVKPGPNPEAPLVARSEIRFSDPRGPVFEFQLDAGGNVTGAILEQGTQRIPLERR